MSVPAFVRNAETYGWEKVGLNLSLSSFAFDSQGSIYFLHSNKLYYADENFVIKDSMAVPLQNGTLYPSKIFINENDVLFLAEYNSFYHVLYVSSDKGKNWFYPETFKGTQIKSFSSKGNRAYITSSGHDESGAMVQISEDNGKTWRVIASSGTSGNYDFCKENDSGEIFFAGSGSLFYSGNYGATISEKKFDFQYPWYNSLAFGLNKDLILGNGSGIYLTKDNGLNWQCIYNNTNSLDFFTLFSSPNGYIYALHRWESSYSGLVGVYVSKDGGITWYNFLQAQEEYFYGNYQLGKDGYLYIVFGSIYNSHLYRSKVKL